jgi:3-isopropylmalate/(R)-2-methylmalate dehydratase small subunit
MNPVTLHTGLVAPFDRANIDTDMLMPKAFLKRVDRTGFGQHLFDDLRYLDTYREDFAQTRRENPEFVLNRHPWRHASILLTRANFGCGSSREHALWGLVEFGFRAIIASSFSDIFFSNSLKNALLPVVLPIEHIDHLFELSARQSYLSLTVDLQTLRVVTPAGRYLPFALQPAQRDALLQGFDEIAVTLLQADRIRAFEAGQREAMPWL